MSPVVADLTATISDPVQAHALWWALAAGADFGGNLTAVGASANVVMLGIAARAGHPDQFLGIHPQGRDRHGTDHRDRGPLPLAALLRIQLTSARRRAFGWQVRPLSTCRAPHRRWRHAGLKRRRRRHGERRSATAVSLLPPLGQAHPMDSTSTVRPSRRTQFPTASTPTTSAGYATAAPGKPLRSIAQRRRMTASSTWSRPSALAQYRLKTQEAARCCPPKTRCTPLKRSRNWSTRR